MTKQKNDTVELPASQYTPPQISAGKQFLNEQSPDQQIDLDERQNWPTYSPDLIVLDFQVWGYMKHGVLIQSKKRKELFL